MADMLSTGVSGLLAFQRALVTAGNNIANANTEGYSRQRVELSARQPEAFGNGYVGKGVDVVSIRRIFDQFVTAQYRGAETQLGSLTAFAQIAERVDNVMGDANTGVPAGITSFFAAWQQLANNPTSTAARQLLLTQAEALADRFRQTSQRLADIDGDINARIGENVGEINSLARSIAGLNEDIETAESLAGGQPPNDLLDQRDRLLTQLAGIVDIQAIPDGRGAVNVFIGNGQALVLRNQASQLGVQRNEFDPARLEIVLQTTGPGQIITGSLTGGALGGYLGVREQVVDVARDQLGLIATALATTVNAQQREGLDLQGLLGRDLFSFGPPSALATAANTGTATVGVSITDLGAATGDEYTLRYDGANWQLLRAPGASPVTLTGTGTVADPLRAEGLAFVITGAAAAGDRYLVRPARDAAGTLRLLTADPRSIAAAAPIRATGAVANLGSAQITQGEVLDVTDPNLLATVSIQFLTANSYSVNGGPPLAYTSGANIDVNGWRVQISGVPAAGDTFTVARNANGTGDNRNALLLAGLQTAGVLAGGTASFTDAYGGLIGTIGARTRQAQLGREAQQGIVSAAREQLQSISGVNLDEEAADLLRWQQAYAASAKSIAIADNVFQTLLGALRG